ncbi:MAG: hypothetical protein ACD_70C00026G0001 [uncultured bacterium]|nr:MAG: hypothetical protein ACD_70C00026G0001 [uncultured bacterium]
MSPGTIFNCANTGFNTFALIDLLPVMVTESIVGRSVTCITKLLSLRDNCTLLKNPVLKTAAMMRLPSASVYVFPA